MEKFCVHLQNCNFHYFSQNGMQPKDDEMKWNHKKRAKDRFLLFCETVLNHERELLSEVRKKIPFLKIFLFVNGKKFQACINFSLFVP